MPEWAKKWYWIVLLAYVIGLTSTRISAMRNAIPLFEFAELFSTTYLIYGFAIILVLLEVGIIGVGWSTYGPLDRARRWFDFHWSSDAPLPRERRIALSVRVLLSVLTFILPLYALLYITCWVLYEGHGPFLAYAALATGFGLLYYLRQSGKIAKDPDVLGDTSATVLAVPQEAHEAYGAAFALAFLSILLGVWQFDKIPLAFGGGRATPVQIAVTAEYDAILGDDRISKGKCVELLAQTSSYVAVKEATDGSIVVINKSGIALIEPCTLSQSKNVDH